MVSSLHPFFKAMIVTMSSSQQPRSTPWKVFRWQETSHQRPSWTDYPLRKRGYCHKNQGSFATDIAMMHADRTTDIKIPHGHIPTLHSMQIIQPTTYDTSSLILYIMSVKHIVQIRFKDTTTHDEVRDVSIVPFHEQIFLS